MIDALRSAPIGLADCLGALAAVISALSLVPQIVKSLRTRSVDDLSLGWLLAAVLGASLWMAYGLLAPAWAVVAGNAIPLALVVVLTALKLAWRPASRGTPPGARVTPRA